MADQSYPLIFYEQKTFLLPAREASHWESGFIRVLQNGLIEISNAQDSGRVEVLQGKMQVDHKIEFGFKIEFLSLHIANDARLVQTKRIFSVQNNNLNYRKFMATHTTPKPKLIQHLAADLIRIT